MVAEAGTAPTEARAFRLTAAAVSVVAVVVLALAALVAVALPYGEWDAMAYGTWSRLIAEHWPHVRFAAAGAVDYHRPFFYFLQGSLWALFGFHQALGRLLSLAFAVLLAAAAAYIATRAVPRRYGLVAASVVVALLVAAFPFEHYIASGMSDIPVAAMLAATAAAVYARRLGRFQLPVVASLACLSQLTKPSALTALLGLAAAVLVGPRSSLRPRAAITASIAAGTTLALVYDEVQARYVHMGLRTFLTTGTDGFYASLAAQRRHETLLYGNWLGVDLRIFMIAALVYAVARVAGVPHRAAVLGTLPAALVWSLVGPQLSGDGTGVLPGTGSIAQQIAVYVLFAGLLFALDAPPEVVPSRFDLARLLVWLTPPLVVWALYAVYDVRLLSPAWPPLFLLIGLILVPAFAGALKRREVLVAAPIAALLVIAVLGTEQMNGLGGGGWQRFGSALGNSDALRSLAVGGDFNAELDALAPQVQPGRTIVTADARLQFHYLDQVRLGAPQSCGELLQENPSLFVLLESDEERTLYGAKAESAYWQSCARPKLTKLAERPGAFALFTTGNVNPTVGGCGAPAPTSGLAIEFGRFRTAAQAAPLVAQARKLGFVQVKIEQLGCALYRVVETGVPTTAVGRSIVAEAAKAHLKATVVSTP